jgi:pilus assembly protein CpaC
MSPITRPRARARARHRPRARSLLLASTLRLAAALCAATTLAALPSPAFAQRSSNKAEEIQLTVGQTHTVPTANISRYSVGNKDVVDVRVDDKQFVLVGKNPGTTSLLLIKDNQTEVKYEIVVCQQAPQNVKKELDKLLSPYPNVRYQQTGCKFTLTGNVPTEGEGAQLRSIADRFQGQVDNLVLVGLADKKLLIRLDFFFVQYDKTSLYQVGLGMPESIGGEGVVQSNVNFDLVSGTTTAAQASVVNQPLPRLDIAARKGWAKVFKQSTVITSNGSEATYQTGGEQNFRSVPPGTVGAIGNIQQIKFGTNVTVLPRYESNTRDVEIRLKADVADLLPPIQGDLPARNTTTLETLVTLKLGQGLILSGIHTANQRRDSRGLPFLHEIPILGILFGTNRYDSAEVEGSIFIVPSVIETVPKSALEMIRNAMSTYKDYAGDIENVDAFPKQPPSAK